MYKRERGSRELTLPIEAGSRPGGRLFAAIQPLILQFQAFSLTYPSRAHLLKIGLLFGLYSATGWFGLQFYAVNDFAAFIWPPSGIALAALLLYGQRLWPGIMLGAFAVNLLIGAHPIAAIFIAAGNTLEGVVSVYVLRRYIGFSPLLSRLQDALGFIGVAMTVPILAATIGVLSLWLSGTLPAVAMPETWAAWWLADLLSILVLTPFLVRWLSRLWFRKTRAEIIEGMGIFSLLVGISAVIFWTSYSRIGVFPVVYLLFIPLIWAALRSGPRGMTLAVLLLTIISLSGAAFSPESFGQLTSEAALLALQMFLAFIAIIFLTFTSLVEERKEATRRLEMNIANLKDALEKISSEDQAKNDFLATLAHELRNPLSPVVSSLELMRMEAKDLERPQFNRLLDTAESHVRTLAHLLDDLLDVSRISRKKFKLQKETVELQSIVRHSQETVEAFYKARNHMLSVSMPKKTLWLHADPLRLEQILVNILYNAGKYTDPGGRIWLDVSRDEGQARIKVRDNGAGIASHMLGKIFDPFVQGNPNAKIGTGLGIGLSLTKRLVELHGGRIWAESAGLGKGSEFIVLLPIPEKIQLPIPEPSPRSPAAVYQTNGKPGRAPAGPSYRILIVDDNEAAAEGLQTLLAYGGHETAIAYDGRNALEQLEAFRPEIILLDIGLPDMDGYAVARSLRSRQSRDALILVALTGYGQEEDKEKAQRAGFNYHLTKPAGIADIEGVLKKVSLERAGAAS